MTDADQALASLPPLLAEDVKLVRVVATALGVDPGLGLTAAALLVLRFRDRQAV